MPIKIQKSHLSIFNPAGNAITFLQIKLFKIFKHPSLGIILLISIATGILLIAFFNYMNIAIASASGRLKEIGIRKVIGSEKQIMFQFITENLILCTMGVLFGLLLSRRLLPWFQNGRKRFSTGMFTNIHVWIGLLALVILSILWGAFYPSIYISSLQPVSIVKGNWVLSNKNRLEKYYWAFSFASLFRNIDGSGICKGAYHIQDHFMGYDPGSNIGRVKPMDPTIWIIQFGHNEFKPNLIR